MYALPIWVDDCCVSAESSIKDVTCPASTTNTFEPVCRLLATAEPLRVDKFNWKLPGSNLSLILALLKLSA